MNATFFGNVENMWNLAGWTMIHFLWLGTLVAAAAFACRWIVRRASANVRYAVALLCLVLLAALPIAIAAWLATHSPSLKEGADGVMTRIATISTTDDQPHPARAPRPGDVIELHRPAAEPVPSATIATPTSKAIAPTLPAAESSPSPVRQSPPQASLSERGIPFADLIEDCIPYLPWLWIIGTPITFALTATGLVGTRRLRRACRPVTEGPIVDALQKLDESLRITRRVAVAVCDRIAAPVLIGILRPMILLPPAALTGYSPDEIEMVLLHELAHVRRWDNLANLVQRLVESLLFFHPAVWLISAWVRREREACCDALVVTRTDRPHAYAELLVALAAQMPRSVLFQQEPSPPGRGQGEGAFAAARNALLYPASSAMAAGPLRSRIRRILKLDDDPMLVSGKSIAILLASLLAMATLIGLSLPTGGRAEASDAESTEKDDAASTAAKFPHKVPFEKGASKFLDGDAITIDEIRGTAKTFEPGNRYWIKGTYQLKSHDRAQISAFTTAKKAEDGKGPIQSEQTKQIEGGEGTFTLILRMSVRGWPHVSFFPADGGDDFGGIYIGTGDSVLKKWWGTEKLTDTSPEDVSKVFEKLGIDPKKDLAAADAANMAEMFNVTPANPIAGSGYSVSPEQRKTLEAAFDTIRNGPLGKHVHFENKWDEHNSGIIVIAPKLALAGFFDPIIRAVGAPAAIPANTASKFPSLEEQRLADFAWKRLNLELEPIGEADLKRVKALGYDGGLKVVVGTADIQRANAFIQAGDILVGLHAWPTTTMRDLAQILSRDDIGQLSPLKFYVIRRDTVVDPNHPDKAITKDDIHTGRINVILGGGGLGGGDSYQAPTVNSPYVVKPQPVGANESRTSTTPSSTTSEELDILRDRIKIAEMQFANLNEQLKKGSKAYSKDRFEIAAYELALAQANLATAEGKRDEALAKLVDAQAHAEEGFKAITAAYDAGRVSYDLLRNEANRLAEIKLKVARLKREKSQTSTSPSPNAAESWTAPSAASLTPTNTFSPVSRFPAAKGTVAQSPNMPYGAPLQQLPNEHSLIASPATPPRVSTTPPATGNAPGAPNDYAVVVEQRIAPDGRPVYESRTVPKASALDDSWTPVTKQSAALATVPRTPYSSVPTPAPANARVPVPSPMSPAVPEYSIAPNSPAKSSTNSITPPADAKSALRYDGKTFDEWRTAWRTELSTEKRVEAVKALAAFGANGYGKEAAVAILDVAGQYDWKSTSENKAVAALQNACLEAFGGMVEPRVLTQSLPSTDTLPVLSTTAKSSSRQQKLFATEVLPYIESPESVALRLALSNDKDAIVRNRALSALPNLGTDGCDEKVAARIREALKSKDPEELVAAMRLIWPTNKSSSRTRYPYLSELAQWIFAPQPSVRQWARNLATGLQGDDATHIAEVALTVLKDDSKKEQHIEAIRALAALGPNAKGAVDALRPLVKSQDQPLAIAATLSLRRILKQSEYAKLLYDDFGKRFNLQLNGKSVLPVGDQEESGYHAFQRALRDEETQLFPRS